MISKKKWNLVTDLLILAIAGGAFISAQTLKEQTGFLPKIVSGLIFILTIWDVISAAAKKDEGKIGMETKRVFIILAFAIGYVLGLILFGYYIATAVFLLGMMYWLGERDWKILIGVPVVFLLMVRFGFVKFLAFKPKKARLLQLF